MKHKVCICIESISYVIIVTDISSADIGKGMIMRTMGRIITISINILFFVALATTFGQDEPDTDHLSATVPTFDVSAVGGRMKAEPDGDAEVISSIKGKQLPIYAVNSDTDYYLIEFEQQLGWIHKNFVYTDDDLSSLIQIDAISVSDFPVISRDGDLTLFLTPDIDAESITITETETFFIIGQHREETFYLIVGDGQIAWIDNHSLSSHEVVGEFDLLPIIEVEDSLPNEESPAEPCLISTNQPRTVLVRIGYGENRTSVTTLAVDTEFEALGQNTDDSDNLWFALDKEIAAPGKSIRGDVAWVAVADVEAIGDCNDLTLIDGSGVLPYSQPVTEYTKDNDNGNTTVTVSVPSQVVWVDTGVELSNGQTFLVSASGLANLCGVGDNPNCVDDPIVNQMIGPDGNRDWEICEGQYDPCQLMPGVYGGLVGRVGGSSSFFIGSGGTFMAKADGTLQLGFNDHKFWDNSGAYTATITLP